MKRVVPTLLIALLISCATGGEEEKNDSCIEPVDDAGEWTPVEFKQINNYDWRIDFDNELLTFDWWHEKIGIRDTLDMAYFIESTFDFSEDFPSVVTNPSYNWNAAPPATMKEAAFQALEISCIEAFLKTSHWAEDGREFVNMKPENRLSVFFPIPSSGQCLYDANFSQGFSINKQFSKDSYPEYQKDCEEVFEKNKLEEESLLLYVSISALTPFPNWYPFLNIDSVWIDDTFPRLKVVTFPIFGPYLPQSYPQPATRVALNAYLLIPAKYRDYQFGFELLTDPELCPAVEPTE